MDETQKQMILKSTMAKVNSIPKGDLTWIMQNIGINIQDEYGNTVLHVAASAGMDDICHALTESGASTNIPNRDGQRPADLALEAGHLPLALSLRSNKDHSSPNYITADRSNEKNLSVSGTFLPMSETQLLNLDEDWSLPDELREDKISANEAIEVKFASEIERFKIIFSELGLKPEQCIISLYLKLAGIIKTINMINESKSFAGCRWEEGNIDLEIYKLLDERIFEPHARIEERLIGRIKGIRENVNTIREIYASIEFDLADARSSQQFSEAIDALAGGELELQKAQRDLIGLSESLDHLYLPDEIAPLKQLRNAYLEILTFQDAISCLCDIVRGDLMSNDESEDEDLLRLDIKIDILEDLKFILHETNYEPLFTNTDYKEEFSKIWDGRILQE